MAQQNIDENEIEAGQKITTLEEANQAVLEQDLALAVQPPAPKATKYYFTDNGWRKMTHGHSYSSPVDVDAVRERVKWGLNNSWVRAVEDPRSTSEESPTGEDGGQTAEEGQK